MDSSDLLSRAEMESFYRDYIGCINAGSIGKNIDRLCCHTLTYNDRQLDLADYQAKIDAAFEHMSGTRFDIDLLTADAEAQTIAARLTITGTLIKEWPEATSARVGQAVVFREHVFYRLEYGRILDVWSLIRAGTEDFIEPR